MQELSTHKTQALPEGAREVLEKLLGRRLADDEEVSIWASRPHMAARVQGPAEGMEKLVDEVCDEVRHRSG